MKKILLSAILLFSSVVVADMSATKNVTDTTKDFIGTFNLTAKRESGNSFCFEDIRISNVGNQVTLNQLAFAGVEQSYVLVQATLNSVDRVHAGSHDATSATKHYDNVTLDKNTLVFRTKYTPRLFSIPLGFESDSYTVTLSSKKDVLNITRKLQTNLTTNVAVCEYLKIK